MTSNPIQSTDKRMFSSPDDATEIKKDREQSPTFPVSTSGSASAIESSWHNEVILSSEDLTVIANKLTESFSEQMQFMVKNLVETMIPEIV